MTASDPATFDGIIAGAGTAHCLLTGRLQVRAVAGLRVVDAGLMPTIASGNTNAPPLMFAERAAESIAETDATR